MWPGIISASCEKMAFIHISNIHTVHDISHSITVFIECTLSRNVTETSQSSYFNCLSFEQKNGDFEKETGTLHSDVNFTSDAEKDAFCGRLSAVRDQITPSGSHTLNNRELLSALFDLVDKQSLNPAISPVCFYWLISEECR